MSEDKEVYLDLYDKSIELDVEKDCDKLIMLVNALASNMQAMFGLAKKMSSKRQQKFEKYLGGTEEEAKKKLNDLARDARFMAYGLRDGDNPYSEQWDRYQKIKSGDFSFLEEESIKESKLEKKIGCPKCGDRFSIPVEDGVHECCACKEHYPVNTLKR